MVRCASLRPAIAGRVRLSLLNGFRCVSGASVISLPEGSQRLLVLLSLLAHPAGRAELAGTLWPEATEQRAHGSLRSGLWRLGDARGTIVSEGEVLALAPDVSVDFWESTRLARALFGNQESSGFHPASAIATLSSELLPGWYDDWVLLEAERWRQLRLHGLEALSRRLIGEGRFGEALEAAMAAVRAEPLRESAHIAAITVHLAEGNSSEAILEFERYRHLIQAELHLEPTESITGLVRALTHP
jgi:DNA-binding SARP family transcriptional activator